MPFNLHSFGKPPCLVLHPRRVRVVFCRLLVRAVSFSSVSGNTWCLFTATQDVVGPVAGVGSATVGRLGLRVQLLAWQARRRRQAAVPTPPPSAKS